MGTSQVGGKKKVGKLVCLTITLSKKVTAKLGSGLSNLRVWSQNRCRLSGSKAKSFTLPADFATLSLSLRMGAFLSLGSIEMGDWV